MPLPQLRPILLADDDEDDLFFTRRAIVFAGVANPIITVRCGDEAIAYLSKLPSVVPCVAFIDVKMPLGGFEVLRWVKQNQSLRDVKVIILSGSDLPQDHARATALGADGYLVKFPSQRDILNSVTSVGGIETTETRNRALS